MQPRRLTTLHENRLGLVRKCSCCDEVQMVLGTFFCSLPKAEFLDFGSYLEASRNALQNQFQQIGPHQKILISTGITSHQLAVSEAEYGDLVDLVENARILLTVEELLNVE